MSNAKKFVSFLCCLAVLFSAVCAFGCGGPVVPPRVDEQIDDETDTLSGSLNIRVWDGGYGTVWLENVIDLFTEKYHGCTVELKDSVERNQVFGDIVGNQGIYDIIFSESQLSVNQSEANLEPLDWVYESTNPGETTTVADKLEPFYLKTLDVKGHYYAIPSYVGALGLVRNCEYVSDDEVPRTTEELKTLCANLKSSVKPFIFSGEPHVQYWNSAYCAWFAQYEGVDVYNAALFGKTINADGVEVVDPATTYLEGGLQAMQVCEDLLWFENGYIIENSTGAQFINVQRDFLRGNAAMMYNGSWMMNEMKLMFPNGPDSEFKMEKLPVISAIRNKCTTIENDAELSALVKAIDAGSSDLTGTGYDVNQTDFNKVKEARGFFYAGSEGATAVIPKATKNKELAKRFLRFLYSDASIAAHASAKVGSVLPIRDAKYMSVLTDLDPWLESSYNILTNNDVFFNIPGYAVTPYCTDIKQGCIEKQFGSQNASDRKRATESFNAKKTLWTANDNDKFWTELINKGVVAQRP